MTITGHGKTYQIIYPDGLIQEFEADVVWTSDGNELYGHIVPRSPIRDGTIYDCEGAD